MRCIFMVPWLGCLCFSGIVFVSFHYKFQLFKSFAPAEAQLRAIRRMHESEKNFIIKLIKISSALAHSLPCQFIRESLSDGIIHETSSWKSLDVRSFVTNLFTTKSRQRDVWCRYERQTAGVEFDPTKPHQCLRLVNIPKCIVLSIFNSTRMRARCGSSFDGAFYCSTA